MITNRIIDDVIEEAVVVKCNLEKSDIIWLTETVLEKHGISKDELAVLILDLIADKEFDLVKYASEKDFIHNNYEFTREDVILELKIYLWSYLFPENELTNKEQEVAFYLLQIILINCSTEERWMFGSDIRIIISKIIGKDLYDVYQFTTKLWGLGKIEYKKNDEIDINGFRYYNKPMRWKNIGDTIIVKL